MGYAYAASGTPFIAKVVYGMHSSSFFAYFFPHGCYGLDNRKTSLNIRALLQPTNSCIQNQRLWGILQIGLISFLLNSRQKENFSTLGVHKRILCKQNFNLLLN
jgi:hypothetical protein